MEEGEAGRGESGGCSRTLAFAGVEVVATVAAGTAGGGEEARR